MSTVSKNWSAFGKTLSTLRERRGWLQFDLAKHLGVGQQTVSRWERGASRPQRPMLKRLADLFQDYSSEEWISFAGYRRTAKSGVDKRIDTVVAPPLLPTLPLYTLRHERFEDFCRDVFAAHFSDAEVHRFGGQGDQQDGIDIEVKFTDGKRFAFQCKQHKTFGPEKVRSAVRALKTEVDRAYILLSRPATAAARKAIKPYRKWELWDSDKISEIVRQELVKDKACTLVDTYFPGLRRAFLDIEDPSPFLLPEQYFAPFLKQTIFSHRWDLVGRAGIVQQLSNLLARESRSVSVLSGSGGIGKSRILRALCQQFNSTYPNVQVRLIDSSANVTPKHFDLLRGQEALVLVDDAHDRSDLGIICGMVARSPDPIRLLLVTRPYALSVLKAEISRAGLLLPEDAIVTLSRLQRNEVEELARQILAALNSPIAAASDIARITADSPLATVVGSYLVATKRIHPVVLSNEAKFRDELFRSFEDAITGKLVNIEDPKTVRDVLGLVALLQPLDPDDPNFQAVVPQILGQPIDTVLRTLTRLHESGVLVKRGRRLRIIPDLLGEYILEDRCVAGVSRSSSGFAERVAACVGGDLLSHLMVNFSRLDWRLSNATEAADHIAEPLWESLMRSYVQNAEIRSAITQAISEAAYYLPLRALQFADIIKDDDQKELPALLRHVAYNLEYVDEACSRLWTIGKGDTRALNRYSEHPFRVLCELAEIERDKPVEYCMAVVDFAIRELRNPKNHEHEHSLFDVLEAALKTEGVTTQSRGYAITFTRFVVRWPAVKALRQKIITTLLEYVQEGHSRAAVQAARAIGNALRGPISQDDDWSPEFLDTLKKVKSIFATNKLDSVVTVELQRAISWHAQFAPGPTRMAAIEANEAIRNTLENRLTLNLMDGWGHMRERVDDNDDDSKNKLEDEMRATARDLFVAYPTTEQVRKVLEESFTTLRELRREDEQSSNVFIRVLTQECPDLCQEVWSAAIAEGPKYPLTSILSCLLGELINKNIGADLKIAQEALITKWQEFSRAVAFAYGWHCDRARSPMEEEIDLIATLCIHEDPNTVSGIIRALPRVAAKDKKRAHNILLSIDFTKSSNLVHEMFSIALHDSNLRVEALDAETFEKLLEKLLSIDQIDDYWVTQFLVKASAKHPEKVLEFLLDRIDIERSRKEESLYGYDAIPWGWGEDAKLAYRDLPDFAKHVANIVYRLKGRDDSMTDHRAATLFSSVCRDYDDITLAALSPFLFSSDIDEVKTASALLAVAPRDFVFRQALFVCRLIEHANLLGQEALKDVESELWSSSISGVRRGSPGQPFKEDVEMLDSATRQLANLPRGSATWRFYAGLKRYAETSINSARRDRPEFENFDEE